jgi:hypothetical protein
VLRNARDHSGECEKIQHGDGYNGPEMGQAIVVDAESYKAWLVTDEDFGCILWEQKDN